MPLTATVLLLALGQTPAGDAPTPARPARECPALFGSEARHSANQDWRGAAFHGVRRTERMLEVIHSVASWRAPVTVRLPGVEVVEIEEDEAGERHAHLRVDEELGACAGDYKVGVDDSIGADGHVLAVLDEGVLAMHDGDLVLLPTPGAPPPSFRMIWRSGFVVDVAENAKKGSSRSTTSAAKRKRGTKRTEASRATRKPRRATTTKKPKG